MSPNNQPGKPEKEDTSFGALTRDAGYELADKDASEKDEPYISSGLTQQTTLADMNNARVEADEESAMELLASKQMQDRLNAKILTASEREGKPLWMKSISLLIISLGLLYFSAGQNDTPAVQMGLFILTSILLVCVILVSIYGLIIAKVRNERIIYSVQGLIALLFEAGTIILIMA